MSPSPRMQRFVRPTAHASKVSPTQAHASKVSTMQWSQIQCRAPGCNKIVWRREEDASTSVTMCIACRRTHKAKPTRPKSALSGVKPALFRRPTTSAERRESLQAGEVTHTTTHSTARAMIICVYMHPELASERGVLLPSLPAPPRGSQLGVGLSTFRAIQELQNREITENDYDLLMRLHAHASRKTLDPATVAGFATFTLTKQTSTRRTEVVESCAVCLGEMLPREELCRLPCNVNSPRAHSHRPDFSPRERTREHDRSAR